MAQARAAAIADLLEHLVHRIQGISFSRGLKPAQWVALRYLARAEEASRNVTRFAEFHATSKSAASQTLGVLIKKGLVRAQVDRGDPRVKILSLTARGKRLIQSNPLRGIVGVLDSLETRELEQFGSVLEQLVSWTLKAPQEGD